MILRHKLTDIQGGLCGATSIYRNFIAFCHEKFENAFKDLPADVIGPGSQLAEEFEAMFRSFVDNKDEIGDDYDADGHDFEITLLELKERLPQDLKSEFYLHLEGQIVFKR